MCKEHYDLIKHPYFQDGRKIKNLPMTFRPCDCRGRRGGSYVTITVASLATVSSSFSSSSPATSTFSSPSSRGKDRAYFCTFNFPQPRGCVIRDPTKGSVFLAKKLCQGIFNWKIKVSYDELRSTFTLGVAPEGRLDSLSVKSMEDCSQSPCLSFTRRAKGYRTGKVSRMPKDPMVYEHWSYWHHMKDTHLIPQTETVVLEGATVAMEFDSDKQTLSYFVDGRKVPRVVTRVYDPLFFGVTGSAGCFLSLAFARLPNPTRSSVSCTSHEYECLADGDDDDD